MDNSSTENVFDTKSFVNNLDARNDARAILPLMKRSLLSREPHTSELAPHAFELPYPLLESSVKRVLRNIGLSDPSYVVAADRSTEHQFAQKVAISIPAEALSAPEVQQRLGHELAKAHQTMASIEI